MCIFLLINNYGLFFDGDPDSRRLESGFGSRSVISKKVYVVEAKKASRVNMHINVLSYSSSSLISITPGIIDLLLMSSFSILSVS